MKIPLKPKIFFYISRKEIRYFLAQYPKIYLSQQRNLYGFVDNNRMLNSNTEIVIEGFPSSANSFAVAAFRIAQNREVCLAHHMHDSSQLIAAVKANIPAIALIRFPDDAIVSYVVRFSNFSNEEEVIKIINNQLNQYIDFYRRIVKYKKSLVIADFKILTSSYDSIIKQVNNKYGKNFNLFFCNNKNIEQVFAHIDRHNKQRLGYINEKNVARPSIDREKIKEELKCCLDSLRLKKLLIISRNLYSDMTS